MFHRKLNKFGSFQREDENMVWSFVVLFLLQNLHTLNELEKEDMADLKNWLIEVILKASASFMLMWKLEKKGKAASVDRRKGCNCSHMI